LLWQSGRNTGMLVSLLAITAAAPTGAAPVGWAHQAPSYQQDGQITVKGSSGLTYSSQLNPVGAVAKTDQAASVQSPTVIIQSTNSGNAETIPLINASSTAPTCPAGYSASFSKSGAGCPTTIWNIGGSRFSLVWNGGSNLGFGTESFPGLAAGGGYGTTPMAVCTGNWSAVLCTK
jgi:hypothetical protein